MLPCRCLAGVMLQPYFPERALPSKGSITLLIGGSLVVRYTFSSKVPTSKATANSAIALTPGICRSCRCSSQHVI